VLLLLLPRRRPTDWVKPPASAAMATSFPDDCRYTDSHEYVRSDGPLVRIGITSFAVEQLGDIVFVELPEVGATLTLGQSFGSVESVKAVEDLIAPISGTGHSTRPATSSSSPWSSSTARPRVAASPARPSATADSAHMVPQVTAMTRTDPCLTPVAAAAGGCEEVKDTRHDTDVDQRSSNKMIN
jgi:hypothetical protein